MKGSKCKIDRNFSIVAANAISLLNLSLDTIDGPKYNFDECKTKLLEIDNLELVDIDETNVDEVILSQTRKE